MQVPVETREGVHSLELELRGLGSHVMGVLGPELRSSAAAVKDL